MVATGDYDARLRRVRALRDRIHALPDGLEIMGTIRAEVEPAPHPPEPPARHGELIIEALELLDDPALSPDQALELRRTLLA